MTDTKQKKSFKSLSKDMKALRKRSVPKAQIDRFNKISDEIERSERQEQDEPRRKIAKDSEATH